MISLYTQAREEKKKKRNITWTRGETLSFQMLKRHLVRIRIHLTIKAFVPGHFCWMPSYSTAFATSLHLTVNAIIKFAEQFPFRLFAHNFLQSSPFGLKGWPQMNDPKYKANWGQVEREQWRICSALNYKWVALSLSHNFLHPKSCSAFFLQ